MVANIIRDLPEADYHARPALSAGGAWLLAQACPAIYWYGSPFNPDAAARKSNKPMDIGVALHLAALEPNRLNARTVVIEHDDFRTKEARDQRDAAYAAGRVPLLTKDDELVDRLRDALFANQDAARLIDDAETEVSYFWDADGVPCKARADLVARDGSLGDLKASASASPEFFQRQAFNAGHFLRAAWYMDGWQIASGHRPPDYWFIVVAREPPHLVTVCRLDERAIEWGRMMIGRSLALFRRCMDRGEWPPYCDGPVTLGLPTWAEFRLADQEQAGDFDAAAIERGNNFLEP